MFGQDLPRTVLRFVYYCLGGTPGSALFYGYPRTKIQVPQDVRPRIEPGTYLEAIRRTNNLTKTHR